MIDTVVVGGGISGLTLTWRLMREGREVVLLEASGRVGGTIRSTVHEGITVEHGPQAFPTTALPVFDLITELGITDEVLVAREAARKRFLLHKGKLEPLPQSFADIARSPLLGMRAVGRAMGEPLVRKAPNPGESVYDFISRRFGRAVAERFATALVAGVYGGDARDLEVGAAFEDWVHLERTHGSVLKGAMARPPHPAHAPNNLFTLRGGMERVTAALGEALREQIRLNTPVERIERDGDTLVVRGPDLRAREVVVTVPPGRAAAMLPELADLRGIPTAPIAGVHLAFDALPERTGFGWLAPMDARRDVLGCLWVSSGFPDFAGGKTVKRLMIGGTRDPGAVELDDDALVARAARILREVEGVHAEPVFTHVARSRIGIPQYVRGHLARMRRLQAAMPGLSFLGWGYTGVGVNHCVQAAGSWRGSSAS
ncbi:MAG: protoporphyrinogen oxidase [Deltaproteobacteria bacterium]|nr:MAG: protoporphyrinogen oxidase [Deltaproteobacteria bacterium]